MLRRPSLLDVPAVKGCRADRRSLLQAALLALWQRAACAGPAAALLTSACASVAPQRRVRPGDAGWPTLEEWESLGQAVGGRLQALHSPFGPDAGARRAEAMAHLDNPFYIGDTPALSQTSGWVDAWLAHPAAYAIASESAADVAAAVNFARRHGLRLVVRGGGHSYQGTSQSPDALMIWTRHMNEASLHDAFTSRGGEGRVAPVPAVSLGAGAMWCDAYDAVTTRGGRYVQGGGCATVGVPGLVQSGGFGNFSKRYGTVASWLLEAEIVTADGRVRVVNAFQDAELFWALKGGGGGTYGVVTRVTLQTHELPDTFGAVFCSLRAKGEHAWRALVQQVLRFYRDALSNPHWGEQIAFRTNGRLDVSMVFQGLSREDAISIWEPLLEWAKSQENCTIERELTVLAMPACRFWDAAYFHEHHSDLVRSDDRPSAPAHHAFWKGDGEQAGWFIHGFHSAWLPARLLEERELSGLVDAIVDCTQHWSVGFHFNKGLSGAAPDAIKAVRATATNPQVLDAFALAIIAGGGPAAFPGMPGTPRDPNLARREAADIIRAATALGRVAPGAGAYVSESDYFQPDWTRAFWGENVKRLTAVKHAVDPDGLFFVRHGIGSDSWSDDGFVRTTTKTYGDHPVSR